MDLESYRMSEALGRLAIRSIWDSSIHSPETFDNEAFPHRINRHDDLAAYIDVMHENRFDRFMAEMDGLTDDEAEEFLAGLATYCRFFMAHFRSATGPLPLSGMLSQYCAYRKATGVPNHARVLEIGPGSGFIPFFAHTTDSVRQFDQIETAEAFYLLQNLTNRYLYGHRFVDHAQIDFQDSTLGGLSMDKVQPALLREPYHWLEEVNTINLARRPRCEHFPWWRVGEVFERKYDLVMSNANLTEFSDTALSYYAALIRAVIEPTGVFIAQCTGLRSERAPDAIKRLIAAGFAPLVTAAGFTDAGQSEPPARPRTFATFNVVLLPAGHPGIANAPFQNPGGDPNINIQDPLTRGIFRMDRPAGRHFSRQEIHDLLTQRLAAEG